MVAEIVNIRIRLWLHSSSKIKMCWTNIQPYAGQSSANCIKTQQ